MAAPDVFRISDDEVMDEIKLSEYISKNDALVSTRYKKLQDAYEGRYLSLIHISEPTRPY